jgi:hypothetical protein
MADSTTPKPASIEQPVEADLGLQMETRAATPGDTEKNQLTGSSKDGENENSGNAEANSSVRVSDE